MQNWLQFFTYFGSVLASKTLRNHLPKQYKSVSIFQLLFGLICSGYRFDFKSDLGSLWTTFGIQKQRRILTCFPVRNPIFKLCACLWQHQPHHHPQHLASCCRNFMETSWFHSVIFNYNIAKRYFVFLIWCCTFCVHYCVFTILCSLLCV